MAYECESGDQDNAPEVGCGVADNNDQSRICVDEDVVVVDGQSTTKTKGSVDPSNVQYMSPIPTLRTSQTIIESNGLSGVNDVEPPQVGMVFKSWQQVEAYYKAYAEQKGFGVTRAQGVYSKGEIRERISTTWRCECWGRPDMRARREAKKRAKFMDVSGSGGVVGGVVCVDELSQRKRKSKKCECHAKVYASVNRAGEWVLRTIELEHSNHTPTPGKAKLVKEYRMKKMTCAVRKKLLHYFDEGVPVEQIHGCIANELEGRPNIDFTVKDMQHEVYKARRLKMLGGDSSAMMSYFKTLQEGDENFFHAERVDTEGRLKDVIWVDARSRAAYEEFGDVVCVDATYLTNEYELPFVNFVGVNHHGQSILLGCALVSHENCDTYTWIFQEWLRCMKNRAPAAILTDQAASMRKPLKQVMPLTRHRWCIWHIMRKIPEKLGKCARYKDFKGVLKGVVYESLDVEEFENKWNATLDKFKLKENDWLCGLYEERHMWVPAYMRDYFWAGMKTTQRVESINSFFDGFVNRKTKLYEFPQKYSKAMAKRVRDESAADANCAKYIRRLITGFSVEKFFQRLYTDTKFQEVQTECSRMMYCYCKEEKNLDKNTTKYVIEDRVWVVPEGQSEEIITDRRRYYSATYNRETQDVSCECRKFITHGIMCKHMMRVLDQNRVKHIPEKYVLNRWRKDILRKHTRVRVSYHDPNKSEAVRRYNKLMGEFEVLCDAAAMVNDEAVDVVSNALRHLHSEVENCKSRKAEESITISFPDVSADSGLAVSPSTNTTSTVHKPHSEKCPPSCDVKDPVVSKKRRGRPKGSRHKTLAEMGFKKPRCMTKNVSTNKTTEFSKDDTNTSTTPVTNIKGGEDLQNTSGKRKNNKGTVYSKTYKGRVDKKKGNKNTKLSAGKVHGNTKIRAMELKSNNKKVRSAPNNDTMKTISNRKKNGVKVPKVRLLNDLVPLRDAVPTKLPTKRKATAVSHKGRPSKGVKVVDN